MAGKEHKLIEGLLAGYESSYEVLFNEYYPVLTIFAKRYLGDLDQSREIVQDVFVRLFESRHLLKDVTSLKGYLYQSVRNSCLNYIKMNKIHNKHKENIRLSQSGEKEDITEQIAELELEQRIFMIVSTLPERCREIFRLSRVNGLKNDEIAEKFNISKRTVETQISKALKTLRIELAPYLTLLVLNVLLILIKIYETAYV